MEQDEATASVDTETDAQVQKMIAQNFRDTTMLVIAHRLETVVGLDRIVVLDAGRVAEFGTPSELMANERSLLAELVAKTDSATQARLRAIARGEIGN